MSRQPIIIQVLSTGDHRTIHRWMMTIGIFTATFLTLAILLTMQYSTNSKHMLITVAIIGVLFGNVLLFVRNNMVDRHSESLCFDGGRCYSVTKSGATHDRSPVRLSYKQEMMIFMSDQDTALQSGKIFAFQVLDRRDWKAIKELRVHWDSVPKTV